MQETNCLKSADDCLTAYKNCGLVYIPDWFQPHSHLTAAMFFMNRASIESIMRIEAKLDVMMEDQQQILTLLKQRSTR